MMQAAVQSLREKEKEENTTQAVKTTPDIN
jgi:hypothetical protein